MRVVQILYPVTQRRFRTPTLVSMQGLKAFEEVYRDLKGSPRGGIVSCKKGPTTWGLRSYDDGDSIAAHCFVFGDLGALNPEP